MYSNKETWETDFLAKLREWHEALLGLKADRTAVTIQREKQVRINFFNIAEDAPLEYHFMELGLVFLPEDLADSQHESIERLGIIPTSVTPNRTYKFPLICPRRHDWSKSGFSDSDIVHRGSYVREHRAQYPDLETMTFFLGWHDKQVTGQQGMIRILPSASPIAQDHFHIRPRNIEYVVLSTNVPTYFTADEIGGVDAWYQREQRG